MAVLRRVVQLTRLSGGFVFAVILDKVLKREEQMTEQRSQALLELVTKLGPAFIKLGQALSIRTDLVPAAYVAGLTKLQDSVRPFEPALGRAVIERELGIRLSDVFSELSPEPVASASIGQVYKGTLRSTGESVAVKVQRPGVLFDVARDLYMLRTLAPAYQRANQINTDLIGLIDAWGKGFVNELDYRQEAAATSAFSAAMAQRGLGSVFAPEVLPDLSSTHVSLHASAHHGALASPHRCCPTSPQRMCSPPNGWMVAVSRRRTRRTCRGFARWRSMRI